MLSLVLLAMISGANPEPVKLAATGFQFVNITPELASFCSEHFAQQLTLEGIRVTTPNEISTMLGFERQKELMGCSDKSTSCLAELANALGVDGLITGTVGKFGKSYQLNIKVLNAADARPLAAYSSRVKDEEQLIDEYTAAAKKLAPQLMKKLGKAPVSTAPPKDLPMPPPPAHKGPTVASAPAAEAPLEVASPAPEVTAQATVSPMRRWFWVPGAAGLVVAGVGTGLLFDARGKSSALTGGAGVADASLTPVQAAALAESGATEQTLGAVFIGVGVAAVAASATMFVLGGREGAAVQPSLSVGPQGGSVGVTGVFP